MNFKLDVNHRDDDGDTILHTAIYADDFKGDILKIYKNTSNVPTFGHLKIYNGVEK